MRFLHLDAEVVEQQAPGDGRAASRRSEIHELAIELFDVGHIGAHHDVDLFIEELGDVDDLVDEVRAELAGLGVVLQHVGLGDPHVDATQEQYVLDVLGDPAADDGQHAQIVAVVHHLGDVRGDGEVGLAWARGHDGHNVFVQTRAVVFSHALGLTGSFDLGKFGLVGLSAGRGRCGSKGDQAQPKREGDTHYYPSNAQYC